MNEDPDYDPNAWKKVWEESLARKEVVAAATAEVQPGDSFLIVTEGTVTEPAYFGLLLETMDIKRAQVRVMPGWASDPRHVIRTAQRVADEQVRQAKKGELGIDEPEKFDHVWAAIDTDVAVRNGIWNEVLQLAEANDVKLAHSTPCIEFWFLLHIQGYTTRGDLMDDPPAAHTGNAGQKKRRAKEAVKEALGREYSTNETVAREAIGSFIKKWSEAVMHAERVRKHHEAAGTLPPGNPSTEVDRLVRGLNDSAPRHLRKL